MVEFLSILHVILNADLFKLFIEVVVSERHCDVEATASKLLSVQQDLSDNGVIFIEYHLVVKELLIHIVILLVEASVSFHSWILRVFLRNANKVWILF